MYGSEGDFPVPARPFILAGLFALVRPLVLVRPIAGYAKLVRIIDDTFVKRFFIAKISCTYTMNYLRQE
jgi:hypothetical protein